MSSLRGFKTVMFKSKSDFADVLNGSKMNEGCVGVTARPPVVREAIIDLQRWGIAVIRGHPGSGRTSSLYHIAHHFSRPEGGSYQILRASVSDLSRHVASVADDISRISRKTLLNLGREYCDL